MKRFGAVPDQTQRAPIDESSIESCSRCSAYLGLEAPSFIALARCWLCGRCGSAYFAVAAEQGGWPPRTSSARAVVYDRVIAAATISRPSRQERVPHRDLHGVLKYLAAFEHEGHDKRRERRHAVALPVMALPLSGNFRVSGAAVEMTTINISRGGAAFMNATPCDASYLSIDFSYAGLGFIQALLEVLRVQQLLSAYEIAGRWYCRVNPF